MTTMMKQVHNQHQTKVAKKKGRAAVVTASKKRKAKPNKSKESKKNQPPALILQDISNAPRIAVGTVIRWYGCQHGDLSAIKSFAKADAKYYIRPNKFFWMAEVA